MGKFFARSCCSDSETSCQCSTSLSRRWFLAAASGCAACLGAGGISFAAAKAELEGENLGVVAKVSTSFHTADSSLATISDGVKPGSSYDESHGKTSFWPHSDTQWVQFDWDIPVKTDTIYVYWWMDGWGVSLPKACRLLFWDGADFKPVELISGYGVEGNTFNETRFKAVSTTRLRLEIDGDGQQSTGILDWQVMSSGPVPPLKPVSIAGVDRCVVVGGQTYLNGVSRHVGDPKARSEWRKVSGPGPVQFKNSRDATTSASFSTPGEYHLELRTIANRSATRSQLKVVAVPPPPSKRLDVVYTKRYAINNPLFNERIKALIVNWIPHVTAFCERTDLTTGQGGLDNFIEAAKAIRGEPHGPHKGFVFANAWVLQNIEAMCIALMVDPQGDVEIEAAQAKMRTTLEQWIPIVLAAQEPDGYLQTAKTLAEPGKWNERWDPAHRSDHEGYIAGYFIESAVNHYTLTEGRDLRLYNAAKKLADCWVSNIGPGKKDWFDGHQEMEQALVRFGRFVNDVEGAGHGDAYIHLAQFLLESRRGGTQYDQSHLPPTQQYEAVGHAVRAVYFYSGMADIAAEYRNADYQSAALSLWDNMVNRKYYVTGGVGSGETSEGFGANYSLPHDAYCESCSSCGLVFFQYKMNLAYHDAKYADLYEQTLYNALLGSTDLGGGTFCYTNPLVNTERTVWSTCPCCVANIPRTVLMLPTWTYVKDDSGLYVNLFIGGSMNVEGVAGTDVRIVQSTDYPRSGSISLTVHPATPKRFTLYVRIPNRKTSDLYSYMPEVAGYLSFKVNGEVVRPPIVKGYAQVTRDWQEGDRIELELPMKVQRITCDDKVAANRGKVALAYGPLVFNVETADQADISKALGTAPITAEWQETLLGGVTVLRGAWADGSDMMAVPYYARMNRTGLPVRLAPGGSIVNYAPGALGGTVAPKSEDLQATSSNKVYSQTWLKA